MVYEVKVADWCTIHVTCLSEVVKLVRQYTGCVVTIKRRGE